MAHKKINQEETLVAKIMFANWKQKIQDDKHLGTEMKDHSKFSTQINTHHIALKYMFLVVNFRYNRQS